MQNRVDSNEINGDRIYAKKENQRDDGNETNARTSFGFGAEQLKATQQVSDALDKQISDFNNLQFAKDLNIDYSSLESSESCHVGINEFPLSLAASANTPSLLTRKTILDYYVKHKIAEDTVECGCHYQHGFGNNSKNILNELDDCYRRTRLPCNSRGRQSFSSRSSEIFPEDCNCSNNNAVHFPIDENSRGFRNNAHLIAADNRGANDYCERRNYSLFIDDEAFEHNYLSDKAEEGSGIGRERLSATATQGHHQGQPGGLGISNNQYSANRWSLQNDRQISHQSVSSSTHQSSSSPHRCSCQHCPLEINQLERGRNPQLPPPNWSIKHPFESEYAANNLAAALISTSQQKALPIPTDSNQFKEDDETNSEVASYCGEELVSEISNALESIASDLLEEFCDERESTFSCQSFTATAEVQLGALVGPSSSAAHFIQDCKPCKHCCACVQQLNGTPLNATTSPKTSSWSRNSQFEHNNNNNSSLIHRRLNSEGDIQTLDLSNSLINYEGPYSGQQNTNLFPHSHNTGLSYSGKDVKSMRAVRDIAKISVPSLSCLQYLPSQINTSRKMNPKERIENSEGKVGRLAQGPSSRSSSTNIVASNTIVESNEGGQRGDSCLLHRLCMCNCMARQQQQRKEQQSPTSKKEDSSCAQSRSTEKMKSSRYEKNKKKKSGTSKPSNDDGETDSSQQFGSDEIRQEHEKQSPSFFNLLKSSTQIARTSRERQGQAKELAVADARGLKRDVELHKDSLGSSGELAATASVLSSSRNNSGDLTCASSSHSAASSLLGVRKSSNSFGGGSEMGPKRPSSAIGGSSSSLKAEHSSNASERPQSACSARDVKSSKGSSYKKFLSPSKLFSGGASHHHQKQEQLEDAKLLGQVSCQISSECSSPSPNSLTTSDQLSSSAGFFTRSLHRLSNRRSSKRSPPVGGHDESITPISEDKPFENNYLNCASPAISITTTSTHGDSLTNSVSSLEDEVSLPHYPSSPGRYHNLYQHLSPTPAVHLTKTDYLSATTRGQARSSNDMARSSGHKGRHGGGRHKNVHRGTCSPVSNLNRYGSDMSDCTSDSASNRAYSLPASPRASRRYVSGRVSRSPRLTQSPVPFKSPATQSTQIEDGLKVCSTEHFEKHISNIKDNQLEVQKMLFKAWINHCCPNLIHQDLVEELRDGIKLIGLIASLTRDKQLFIKYEKLRQDRQVYINRIVITPLSRLRHLSNVSLAIDYLRESRGMKLINLNAMDIVSGKPNVILGLCWNLILHFQIEPSFIQTDGCEDPSSVLMMERTFRNWIDYEKARKKLKDWLAEAESKLTNALLPVLAEDSSSDQHKDRLEDLIEYFELETIDVILNEQSGSKIDDISEKCQTNNPHSLDSSSSKSAVNEEVASMSGSLLSLGSTSSRISTLQSSRGAAHKKLLENFEAKCRSLATMLEVDQRRALLLGVKELTTRLKYITEQRVPQVVGELRSFIIEGKTNSDNRRHIDTEVPPPSPPTSQSRSPSPSASQSQSQSRSRSSSASPSQSQSTSPQPSPPPSPQPSSCPQPPPPSPSFQPLTSPLSSQPPVRPLSSQPSVPPLSSQTSTSPPSRLALAPSPTYYPPTPPSPPASPLPPQIETRTESSVEDVVKDSKVLPVHKNFSSNHSKSKKKNTTLKRNARSHKSRNKSKSKFSEKQPKVDEIKYTDNGSQQVSFIHQVWKKVVRAYRASFSLNIVLLVCLAGICVMPLLHRDACCELTQAHIPSDEFMIHEKPT